MRDAHFRVVRVIHFQPLADLFRGPFLREPVVDRAVQAPACFEFPLLRAGQAFRSPSLGARRRVAFPAAVLLYFLADRRVVLSELVRYLPPGFPIIDPGQGSFPLCSGEEFPTCHSFGSPVPVNYKRVILSGRCRYDHLRPRGLCPGIAGTQVPQTGPNTCSQTELQNATPAAASDRDCPISSGRAAAWHPPPVGATPGHRRRQHPPGRRTLTLSAARRDPRPPPPPPGNNDPYRVSRPTGTTTAMDSKDAG